MARLEPIRRSQLLQDTVRQLRTRLVDLGDSRVAIDWRRLQHDAVSALIDAQRTLVGLHGTTLGLFRSDRARYREQRAESLELGTSCDELHELIREIARAATAAERPVS